MVQLGYQETERLLRKYKIHTPLSRLVSSKKELFEALEKIKFPIAMKVYSDRILHKTDVKGIILGVDTKEEAVKAFDQLMRIKDAEAVHMQRMHEGHHVLIGMKRDSQFGPVIAFGLGGIFVNVMKDVSFRIAPITQHDANEMMREIKAYPILSGFRGGKKADFQLLRNILMAVSKLSMDNNEIDELDLNPVIVNEKEAVAVDARFIMQEI